MSAIAEDIAAEVSRVDAIRDTDAATPSGTSALRWLGCARLARAEYDIAEGNGAPTFALAFREEAYEVLAEEDVARLRAELVQVGSLVTRWIRALDARRG